METLAILEMGENRVAVGMVLQCAVGVAEAVGVVVVLRADMSALSLERMGALPYWILRRGRFDSMLLAKPKAEHGVMSWRS